MLDYHRNGKGDVTLKARENRDDAARWQALGALKQLTSGTGAARPQRPDCNSQLAS